MNNAELPVRKKIRLENFDYSCNGAYFITICTKDKMEILSKIKDSPANSVGANCVRPSTLITLSEYGIIINNELAKISSLYDGKIKIDKYVIMPNHIHFIIFINDYDKIGRTQFAPTISRVIKQFKGSITKQIGFPIWQRSFHDRVIRNEKEYAVLWEYIEYNPINWENDCLYSKN